jgi:FKBP-type peptidyl-prolyl cis-trans isomerase
MTKHLPSAFLAAALLAAPLLAACNGNAAPGTGDADTKDKKDTPAADAKSPAAKPGDLPAPPDVAAVPADAQKTASGLASKVLKPGTGTTHPAPSDTVEVHYTGWTLDGHMFDSSVKRGRTAKFPLNRVIKGWTEGLQLMTEGEQRRFWIPADLAYGDTPARPGAPAGMLVFDVELIKIVQAPKPLAVPPVPADVAAPPKDAKKTASGLAYKQVQKGTGTVHPAATDTVEVHYAGWTTDGKMFDNSYERGEPTKFPLNRVIKGWTEGVQLMVVGEKTRFWIPAELAYGNDGPAGAPKGQLVFDVELVSIQGK